MDLYLPGTPPVPTGLGIIIENNFSGYGTAGWSTYGFGDGNETAPVSLSVLFLISY
jgi:hypothetical protein